MTRKLIAATVQFDAEATFKENLFQAVDWKKVINLQAKKVVRKIFHYADVNALQCRLYPTINMHACVYGGTLFVLW